MAVKEIIEQLRSEQQRLQTEREEAAATVKRIDSELKQVQGALRELGQKQSSKSGKQAATKKQVVAAIEELLQERGVVEKDTLKAAAEEKMVAAGKSRQGFALRFEEAIKDERFVDSPSGYRLKTEDVHQNDEQPVNV